MTHAGPRATPRLAGGLQVCTHGFQKSSCLVCKQARHAHGMNLWAALISSKPRAGVSEAEAVARALAAGLASAARMAAGQ